MEQYVQQQRQQWEQISERQYRTEERVDSVVEDLQAVKELPHVRIQAAEVIARTTVIAEYPC